MTGQQLWTSLQQSFYVHSSHRTCTCAYRCAGSMSTERGRYYRSNNCVPAFCSVNITRQQLCTLLQQLWTSIGNNCEHQCNNFEHHYNNPSTFIVHIEHAHVHIYVQVLCQLNVEGISTSASTQRRTCIYALYICVQERHRRSCCMGGSWCSVR